MPPVTRRDFLRRSAVAALTVSFGVRSLAQEGPMPNWKTTVVLIRDPDVLDDQARVRAKVIERMLDEAVTALLDKPDPVTAWRSIIQPDEIVGIKSNVWRFMPTPRELERAIRNRVIDAGVPERNIGSDDRGVLYNPLFKKCTSLVNVRPLRTHFWAGIGGCIKNYIMFVPRPDDYHGDQCADLAAVWKLPIVEGKTRLNILSLLTPLFYGRGPHHFDRKYTWPYRGILVGTDPVAVDAVGAHLLQAKRLRHFGEERRMDATPKHITLADTRHHLGTADLGKIRLIKLGWLDDVLI